MRRCIDNEIRIDSSNLEITEFARYFIRGNAHSLLMENPNFTELRQQIRSGSSYPKISREIVGYRLVEWRYCRVHYGTIVALASRLGN